jgi:hypothetical protein
MTDVDDQGGDPACWLHLFEEEESEGEGDEESDLEAGDGDPGGERPAP